jgi:hypothetical protein
VALLRPVFDHLADVLSSTPCVVARAGQRFAGPHGDAEGEVQRLRDHHPQKVCVRRVPSSDDIAELSTTLLKNEMPAPKPIRLLGVSLSSLHGDEQSHNSACRRDPDDRFETFPGVLTGI